MGRIKVTNPHVKYELILRSSFSKKMSKQPGVAVEFSGDGFSDGRGWSFHAFGGHSLDFVEALLADSRGPSCRFNVTMCNVGDKLKIVKRSDMEDSLGRQSHRFKLRLLHVKCCALRGKRLQPRRMYHSANRKYVYTTDATCQHPAV